MGFNNVGLDPFIEGLSQRLNPATLWSIHSLQQRALTTGVPNRGEYSKPKSDPTNAYIEPLYLQPGMAGQDQCTGTVYAVISDHCFAQNKVITMHFAKYRQIVVRYVRLFLN